VLDETGNAIGKAIFVTSITEFDIQVIARPIFEDKISDAYPLRDFALADIQQLVILVLLFKLVLYLLLLVEVLLLGLVLLVHFLHPSSVQFVKIRKLLEMH
jgi:hypothetical protein